MPNPQKNLLKKEKKDITADFNGVISKSAVQQGAAVTQGMELFTAMPVVIGPYCDKSPALPASMQEQTPTTSRFLDTLEKRHEQNRRQMADAISFAAYRKEADD